DKLSEIPGLNAFALVPPSLPGGGGGPPVQFVIKTTNDFQSLLDVTDKVLNKARQSGLFIYIDNTLKLNQPQFELQINRAKASEMGLDMRIIGSSLTSALSGSYVNYFNLYGRSYQVIPQLERKYRLTEQDFSQIYLKTRNDTM